VRSSRWPLAEEPVMPVIGYIDSKVAAASSPHLPDRSGI
jgi:hypothetical protein